jgi:HlyD family secretion protein
MKSAIRTVLVLLVVIAAAAYGAWYFLIRPSSTDSGLLTASGTVETTEISVAPEQPGKILDVKVEEGDTVKSGETLLTLDDTLLKAQRKVTSATLESANQSAATADAAAAAAQAQYDATLSTALDDAQAKRLDDWTTTKVNEFNQPVWYFTKEKQIAALTTELDAASKALDDANKNLTYVEEKASNASFVDAETRLADVRAAFIIARSVKDRADATSDTDLKDAAQTAYDTAQKDLDNAQTNYDDQLSTSSSLDVLKARAKLSVAQERVDTVRDQLRALQTGALSPKVITAQKTLEQAQAAAAQAHTAVAQSQANLDLIDAQISKTIVTSPVDGVVLTRAAQPGSVVNTGATSITIGRIDELTITVYVPEDRIGEISLNETASVSVDSFPGQTFAAAVSFISNQAEYTPRNVQTVEGRKNTVFAVKLKLDGASGKLKPGMPADVTFGHK